MYTLTNQALERLAKDDQLQGLIALNLKVSPQTIKRWVKQNHVSLTMYGVMRVLAKVMQTEIETLVETKSAVYEPAV